MPDPIRRRPRPSGRYRCFVGPLPEDDAPAPADADVPERMESIRRTLAPTNEALSVPTDPVRDDAALSSIRRGMVDYAREQTSPAAERQRAAAALVRATGRRFASGGARLLLRGTRAPVGVDTTETLSALTSAVRGAAHDPAFAGSWMDEAPALRRPQKNVITGDTPGLSASRKTTGATSRRGITWYDRAAAENHASTLLGSGVDLSAGTLAMGLSPFGARMNNAITAAETSLPAAFMAQTRSAGSRAEPKRLRSWGAIDQAGASDAPLLPERLVDALPAELCRRCIEPADQGGLEGVSWLANRLPGIRRELAEKWNPKRSLIRRSGGRTGDHGMLAGTPGRDGLTRSGGWRAWHGRCCAAWRCGVWTFPGCLRGGHRSGYARYG